MKILLTGHEGYLGSQLLSYFQRQGHSVTGVGRKQDLGKISRSVLEQLEVRFVVNCAAVANRSDSIYVPHGRDEEVNFFGTRHLVEALKGTGIGLMHLSTKDVYGEVYSPLDVAETNRRLVPRFHINESQPFRPKTIYAKTKLMGEFAAEAHPKTCILRLSSGYTSDPHYRGNWILGFCRSIKAGQPVRIKGSGKQLRDPLHVDDLGALILATHEKKAWGYTFNAGAGIDGAYSILEVLDLIDPEARREFSPGGDLGYVTDFSSAERLLGWRPQISFPAELRILIERVKNE